MDKNYESRIVNYALKTCGYYPLRAMQIWIVATHLQKINSTMMNVGYLFKIPAEIDLERFAQAINDTLRAHDIFRCRLMIHPDTNDFCQRFDGEIAFAKIEKISDAEFEQRKKILKKPYELLDRPLYRAYLFETPTAKYFYADFYHAIMDGASGVIVFWREVEMHYLGKKMTRKPPQFADFILDELRIAPEELEVGEKYWREVAAGFDETKHLPPADIHGAQNWKSDNLSASIKNISRKYFWTAAHKEHIFFLAASMLAIAKLTGAKNSLMSMVHNGRNTAQERRIIGTMLEQIPVSWNFEADLSVGNFLRGLEDKVNLGMKYRRSLGTVYNEGLQDDCATFIFQKKFYSFFFAGQELQVVDLPQNQWSAAENSLDIEINLTEASDYYLFLDYDASRYSQAAMEKFAATFDEMVLNLQNEERLVLEILG